MALDLTVEYPGQIATGDPDFPYGKPRNQLVEGDGTGTPWEEKIVQDFEGFLQRLLVLGRTVPNGTPDNATVSQYVEALFKSFQPIQALSWGNPLLVGSDLFPADPVQGNKVAVSPNPAGLVADKYAFSGDGGATWAGLTLGSPTGVVLLAAACDGGSPSKAILTGSKTGGTDIRRTTALDPAGTSWGTTTAPGTPVVLGCALYDPTSSRFIVTGRTAAAPYVATCEASDLTTWTQRIVPGSITGVKDALSLVRFGSTIVATWQDQTKAAYSTDGGVTWTASTTSLTSGKYLVEVGDSGFLAVDSASTSNNYRSTDGITWTSIGATANRPTAIDRYGFKFIGGLFIARSPTPGDSFSYSKDNGATWTKIFEYNRTWASFAVLRNRLLIFRSQGSGPVDYYVERSLPVGLPTL